MLLMQLWLLTVMFWLATAPCESEILMAELVPPAVEEGLLEVLLFFDLDMRLIFRGGSACRPE